MIIDHKMPDAYFKHKVFDDLKYMMEFYDSLSNNCYSFVIFGTNGIVNYASYVLTSSMRHPNYYSLSVRSKSGFTARCFSVRKRVLVK